MEKRSIQIPTLAANEDNLPAYASIDAAGADARAHIQENIILAPGASVLVPTGLRFAIPSGYEIQVRPRSGLALKNQITVLNTPGTVDADYRGDVGIILINHGKEPFTITPGMRIAQFVVAQVVQATFYSIEEHQLEMTTRGTGGFGHTGVL